jgi:hypothetical protein
VSQLVLPWPQLLRGEFAETGISLNCAETGQAPGGDSACSWDWPEPLQHVPIPLRSPSLESQEERMEAGRPEVQRPLVQSLQAAEVTGPKAGITRTDETHKFLSHATRYYKWKAKHE